MLMIQKQNGCVKKSLVKHTGRVGTMLRTSQSAAAGAVGPVGAKSKAYE